MQTETETVELVGEQKLLVERRPHENRLKLLSRDGQLRLEISLTADGPVLRFDGPSLTVESSGDLAVAARRVAIHGREEVAITSGGNASLSAVGDLRTEANGQHLVARLGSVKVKANDNVQLLGEQVLLNCEPSPPMPAWLQLSIPEPPAPTLPVENKSGDPSLLSQTADLP